MDDWTPGFLRDEDMKGSAGDDLGVASLREEFRSEAAEPPSAAAPEEAAAEFEGPAPREGMVTETMAKLYADQGLYEDALGVYRKLAAARPEDAQLQQRIAELEAKLAESRLPPAEEGEIDLAELLDLSDTGPEPAAAGLAAPLDVPPAAPAPAPGTLEPPAVGQDFDFEDEAPVAGMEHLDPFAASFDAMVARAGDIPASAGVGGLADLVASEPPREPAPEPSPPMTLEPAGTEPEPEFEFSLEDEVEAGFDLAPVPGLQPPGADVPPPAPAPPEPPTPPAPAPEAPVAKAAAGRTIEEYLSELLSYSVGDGAPTSASTAGGPAPSPTPPAGDAAESPEQATPGEPPSSEDLEEFQEWLRSLKE